MSSLQQERLTALPSTVEDWKGEHVTYWLKENCEFNRQLCQKFTDNKVIKVLPRDHTDQRYGSVPDLYATSAKVSTFLYEAIEVLCKGVHATSLLTSMADSSDDGVSCWFKIHKELYIDGKTTLGSCKHLA